VNGASIPVDGGLTAHTGQPNFTRLFEAMTRANQGEA